MNVKINKWQRLVVLFGALAFFIGSIEILMDDYAERSPTLPFLLSIGLAFVAFSSRRENEDFLPFSNWIAQHWKATSALLLLLLAIGFLQISGLILSQEAKDVAQADNVEVPAEEAIAATPESPRLPADTLFPVKSDQFKVPAENVKMPPRKQVLPDAVNNKPDDQTQSDNVEIPDEATAKGI